MRDSGESVRTVFGRGIKRESGNTVKVSQCREDRLLRGRREVKYTDKPVFVSGCQERERRMNGDGVNLSLVRTV